MKHIFNKTLFLFIIILLTFLTTCKKDDDNDPENSVSTKFTITPEGGEYNFENGIKLDVPEDAVSEETEIEIKYADLTDDGIISIFNKRGITFNDCYAIIEAKPDGLTFNNPVTVTIPVELSQGAFPSAYEYDLENGTYTPSMTDISFNLDEGIIELALSHFSTHSVEQIKELKKAEEYCEENPCRCEGADIRQTDNDEICKSGDCQVVDFKVTATYPEKCGGTTEMYIVSEIGGDCPDMKLNAEKMTIKVGEQTDITALVTLYCDKNLSTQDVYFTTGNLGSLSNYKVYTNDNGKATVTFTAGDEEGTATITVNTTVKFSKSIVYATGEDGVKGKEETRGDEISKEIKKEIKIIIEPAEEKWKGTLELNELLDDGGNWRIEENYSGTFNIILGKTEVFEGDTVREITGTANLSLNVSFEFSDNSFYENLNYPSIDEYTIFGYSDKYFHLILAQCEKDESNYFIFPSYIFYDICHYNITDDEKHCFSFSEIVYFEIGLGMGGDTNLIPLKEGTYSNTYDRIDGYYETISYTITLQKDE